MNSRPEVLFDGIADRLVLEISKAKSSIYVAVAWLSNEKLFDALVAKAKQGVMVRLMISNDEQTQKNSQKLDYKILNGIGDSDVSLVKPEMGGLMHNKLCIIDRLTVITGSYNWTYYADNKNHENVFIFQDKEVAETCIKHFKEIISHYLNATPPQPKSSYKTQSQKSQKAERSQNVEQSPPPKDENLKQPQNTEQVSPPKAEQPQQSHDTQNKTQSQKSQKAERSQNVEQSPPPKDENSQKMQNVDSAENSPKSQNAKKVLPPKKEKSQSKNQNPNKEEQQKPNNERQLPKNNHSSGNQKTNERVANDYLELATQSFEDGEHKLAFEYYQKSAELGNADAQFWLGVCYYLEYGIEKDYRQSVEWWKKSAELGNADAQFWLGYCYEGGWGTPPDRKVALEWYKKSASQGNERAIERLKTFRIGSF